MHSVAILAQAFLSLGSIVSAKLATLRNLLPALCAEANSLVGYSIFGAHLPGCTARQYVGSNCNAQVLKDFEAMG